MNREEIVDFINKAVRVEHGIPMESYSDKLVETGCDSFGVTMVMLELDQKYNCFGPDYIKEAPVEDWTLGSIIARIEDAS